uniref:Glial cell line-derived neurotrophic factor n=1 Tax=Neogobius melanostomus TaxID=47308 RepID=A0A8C6TXB4_9GOBI
TSLTLFIGAISSSISPGTYCREVRAEVQNDVSVSDIMEESLSDDYEDVVDLIKVTISRTHRSPPPSDASTRTRHRRAKKRGQQKRVRGGQGRGQGRGQDCALKQVQLNVTDLGLGYRSGEEMIFRYCAGPCRKSETNYDKILSNLAHIKRLPPRDRPAQACCRPVAFDDDLSFLDDNLVYHTVRKHSARKCACV